jgi:hypothetical protein
LVQVDYARVVDLDIGASKSDICAIRVVTISERAGRTRARNRGLVLKQLWKTLSLPVVRRLIAKEQHQAEVRVLPPLRLPLFPRPHYDYFGDFLRSLESRGERSVLAQECSFRPRLGATAFAECVIMERPVMAQSGHSDSTKFGRELRSFFLSPPFSKNETS